MEMSLSLCDQRTYQKQKKFILIGNFNCHFDEKVIQKETNYTEFRKDVEALWEDGENNRRKMCYLITPKKRSS